MRYQLYVWNKKRGNVAKCLESGSSAMLKLWALQNTKPHQIAICIDIENFVPVFEVLPRDIGVQVNIDPDAMFTNWEQLLYNLGYDT